MIKHIYLVTAKTIYSLRAVVFAVTFWDSTKYHIDAEIPCHLRWNQWDMVFYHLRRNQWDMVFLHTHKFYFCKRKIILTLTMLSKMITDKKNVQLVKCHFIKHFWKKRDYLIMTIWKKENSVFIIYKTQSISLLGHWRRKTLEEKFHRKEFKSIFYRSMTLLK